MFPEYVKQESKPQSLYLVREKVPYEGDNIWVIAATSKEEAKRMSGAETYNSVSIDKLSDISDYTEVYVVWTNT